ncbi:MAG: DUF2142 domain-containing protein [Microbacterium sp.]|uniref:DUF2142 domain-containing protein n=1 Tax=Microbacterium sp. TaxID=51671 RepID=UPI001D7388A5|nr:DUF2142 domain-containing protein [Microbacterium sp.]MBW8761695.1 DUF2142 domain-containing protein [Microbacterium sp.]
MTPTTRKRFRIALAVVTPLLALLTLIAWSFSSAVASSPDDDFHLPAIWCGLGERPGLCEDFGDPVQRLVPAPLISATCYAFHPDVSGECWNAEERGLAVAGRANADGLYPPVFYAAMAPFASADVAASVLTIRIVNSVFIVGVLTAVFFALPRRLRPVLVVSVVATTVPLGLFLFASTYPSSWAILSAATVWLCLYGALESPTGARQRVLSGLAVFGAFIGAGARADAAIFSVFGVILALLLGFRRRRGLVIPLLAAAAVIVISVSFYLMAGQSGAVTGGLDGNTAPLTLGQHFRNFLGVPGLWVGALGFWGLGWLDTEMPPTVWVLVTAVVGGALFVGLRRPHPRRVLAVVGTLAALWVVPFAMLALSRAVVGTQVQPRYILPLLVIAVAVASASPRIAELWSGTRGALAAGALAVAGAVALQYNTQRYTTGLDQSSIDPGENAEWWWAGAPSPLVIWVGGSLAFALLLAAFWYISTFSDSVRKIAAADREEPRRPDDEAGASQDATATEATHPLDPVT